MTCPGSARCAQRPGRTQTLHGNARHAHRGTALRDLPRKRSVCSETRTGRAEQHVHACSLPQSRLSPHGLQPARLLCPWHFPGKNTGVGYHFLLEVIVPTQRSNLSSPALPGGFFTTEAQGNPAEQYRRPQRTGQLY